MVEFIFTTCSSPENHGKWFRVSCGVDYSVGQFHVGSVCFPCGILYDGITRNFRVLIMHGNTVFVPYVFRVNFLSRKYAELSCTTCTRRHRIDSVRFPCLVVYDEIARKFRVLVVHGNTVFVPYVFRVNFLSRNYTEFSCTKREQ